MNAGDASLRLSVQLGDVSLVDAGVVNKTVVGSCDGLVDTGYIATTNIYRYLRDNRNVNDLLAFINTVIGVFGPGIYFIYTMLWQGDYEPVFRYLAISILRSFCGWFTYLPPSPQYLMSNYDFPDIMQCLIKECGDPTEAELNPFVSFFSGHVATLAIVSNHAYLHGLRTLGICGHLFQIFQITRLLATRGHYSIDIIIGWYMAVYVSNPAGRIGRYFSRADKSLEDLLLPQSGTEAFESVIGVGDVRSQARMSILLKRPDIQSAIEKYKIEQYGSVEAADDDLTNEILDNKLQQDWQAELPSHTIKMFAEGKLDSIDATEEETTESKKKQKKSQ